MTNEMQQNRFRITFGDDLPPEYVNTDPKNNTLACPLDNYEDNSADEIRSSHLLHFSDPGRSQAILNEWSRVLKPGGVLKISVPDFDKIVDGYIEGRGEPFDHYLTGGSIWNAQKLDAMMRVAGLCGIHAWSGDTEDESGSPLSLNLAGYKIDASFGDLRRDVYSVMTRPRFIESNASDCQEKLLLKTGIRMRRSGGVFWTQGISEAIVGALEEKPKYILTIDYDTIFQPEDVVELYALMELYPHANAMVPIQMRRDSIYALLTPPHTDSGPASTIDADLLRGATMPIRSGHFGLTMIRASAIESLPRPWMQAVPNAGGDWGDGRVDADVQFWLNLGGVYSANHVSVGHIQQVITWPGKDMRPIHQYVPAYAAAGKPQESL